MCVCVCVCVCVCECVCVCGLRACARTYLCVCMGGGRDLGVGCRGVGGSRVSVQMHLAI